MDEFKNSMERQEEKGSESGFQLVYGKKNKNTTRNLENSDGSLGVKMASKDKKTVGGRSRVPFHMPSVPRPQDQFNILVNNSNQPFEHVWLERSEDGSRFVHPLEKLSVLNFVDRNIRESELVKPPPVENSPFKLVEEVRELKELAAKLRNVNEFAVDLEHNQYRSFQGLTCLIQISTRTEDFVIDTLKLRVQIGPYLREVFKDPSKRKVMHGADRDILWLQRDFGIYVCNLFDTGQASRVMQLERNSLEFLLHHFCGVNANKEYQNADWRLRPLPDEMLKYAREDTHYLLHIYDLMRSRLLSASPDGNCEALLIEVYKRSYEICIQLYEKELLTDSSFLYIYGLQEADFNAQQLAVVAGLCEWRDAVARAEDESTGYILPNKALLEIARHMPLSSGKLRHLVKSNHPYVERYINSVISIIRSSIGSASSFESVAEQLKKGQQEAAHGQHIEAVGYCSGYLQGAEEPMESIVSQKDVLHGVDNARTVQSAENIAASMSAKDNHVKPANTEHFSCQIPRVSRCRERERLQPLPLPEIGCFFKLSDTADKTNEEKIYDGNTESSLSAKAANVASVKMLKKPTCAFGVLIGNSSSKKKFDPDKGSTNEQDKADTKVEQIKFSVNLPFHSFSGGERLSEPSLGESINHSHPEKLQQYRTLPEAMEWEEVISSGNGMDNSLLSIKIPVTRDGMNDREQLPCHPKNGSLKDLQLKSDTEEDPISLPDLSSSFQKCFQLMGETRKSDSIQFTPFDHADARKHMKFGKAHEGGAKGDDDLRTPGSGGIRKGLVFGRAHVEERVGGFQQPRRLPGFSST